MEGTRLRILQLLQKNSNDTVGGLARTIGLAPATVRRHLDILQRDRLVDFRELRKKTGRPEYSFYLTEQGQEALPKSYNLLLGLVIQEMADLTLEDTSDRAGQQILELVFQRLSSRVWSQQENHLDERSPQSRLAALMNLLEEQGFYPEAEMVDDQLRIRLQNCPFREVALQNQAVCRFDATLMSAMLDANMEQDTCIHDGAPCCQYVARIAASGS